ncbi:uncharacterized protein MONBRDRAFT_29245 [Monosiga brevicollis MX1]|uniref:Nudix hydrolase domain-containing protein n=1 Tax=Monosiga brevicollis TaxID=81824 RepID=A9VAJ3_MONBE|nr:uncharacterized protein MONBRDRAFT_29245 [Monosiga brevicollis MX1]EDQ85552.1 predicted protein [Monosiga brevicollis MX1]|eukprot:XP_001749743.1 hypothetical protein [Monosiga brevicollis MX1]
MDQRRSTMRSRREEIQMTAYNSHLEIGVGYGETKRDMDYSDLLSRFHQHPEPVSSNKASAEDKQRAQSIMERSTTHGLLSFDANNRNKELAPYVRVSLKDDAQDVLKFVQANLYRHFGNRNYPAPSLILSVTGGAQSFDLPPRLRDAIKRGLTKAVASTDAWVVTGGTHSGVMQLTGSIMSDLLRDRFVPVVGVITWGILKDRKEMEQPQYRAKPYVVQDQMFKCPDHNHNMFVFVDSGIDDFGGEIEVRAQFEQAARVEYNAPTITIVIQGGPGTMKTAMESVRAGNPIVVVDGSGLAADVLAYAYQFLHSGNSRHRSHTVQELKAIIATQFAHLPGDKQVDLMHQAFECVRQPDLVYVFNAQDSNSDAIDETILNAIFYGSRDVDLTKKLEQAMNFDRLDIASRVLRQGGAKVNSTMLNHNFIMAMKKNKPDFVGLYLEHGASLATVKVEHANDVNNPSASSIENPANFGKGSRGTPSSEMESADAVPCTHAVEELYRSHASRDDSHVSVLVKLLRKKVNLSDTKRKYRVLNMEKVLGALVDRNFDIKRDFQAWDTKSKAEQEVVASHMFLMYAICVNKYRMAEMFWQRTDQSISNALIASKILRTLGEHKALSGSHMADERAKMLHNSEKFEQLAVGVLSECYSTDTTKTAQMLSEPIAMFRGKNAVRVAYDSNCLRFLSHPAVQAVVNRDWYGSLKGISSWYFALVAIFLPFLIPFVKFADDDAAVQEQERTDIQLYIKSVEEGGPAGARANVPWWRRAISKISRFYNAPYPRFVIDCVMHLALCCVFSIMTMDRFEDELSVFEIIVAIWFLSLIVEELRQSNFLLEAKEYWEDVWNRLDVFLLTLYVIGFILRVHAKTVYSFVAVCLWLRLMRYYAVSPNLGPKLIMMGRMIRDVLVFVFLVIVFYFGFGVMSQALLYPDRRLDDETFENVIFRPYFQIYGELFLEDISVEANCVGDGLFRSCGGTSAWMVLPLLALYILVTNILLVNLLIAMFSDTYARVQSEAVALWHKQNYNLYLEYKERPLLPAPLILIQHVYMLITFILQLCKCGGKQEDHTHEADLDDLRIFQETNTDKFLDELHKEKTGTLENRVSKQLALIRDLHNRNEMLQEQLTHSQLAADRNFHTLRTDIAVLSALQQESISEADSMHRLDSNSMALVASRQKNEASRWFPDPVYPGSKMQRFAVAPEQVDWSMSLPGYNPIEYTHPSVAKGPEWADPADPRAINFNAVANGVDRRSCYQTKFWVDTETGRPRNPHGRTGMTGRGLLGKWGVNWAADPVVTRWRRAANGTLLERDGRKVLEFIAIERSDNGGWAIPGGFRDRGEKMDTAVARELIEETMDGFDEMSPQDQQPIKELLTQGQMVATIYSHDNRNTDNAWIETVCVNFHDDENRYTSKIQLRAGSDARNCQWMMVHSGIKVFASHHRLLKLVAQKHNAYF